MLLRRVQRGRIGFARQSYGADHRTALFLDPAAVNTIQGKPYKAASAEALPGDLVRFDELPADGEMIVTAGVDVGRENLHVGVVAHDRRGRTWVIERRILTGATDDIRAGSAWADLATWIRSGPTWERAGGAVLPLRCAFVDSGYETSAAYDFSRTVRGVEAIKGVAGWGRPPIRRSEVLSARGRPVRLWLIGVDGLKARTVRGLARGTVLVHSSLSESDLDELTGERLVWRRRPGRRPERRWEQVAQRQRVELLDCAVYALAAADYVAPKWRAGLPQTGRTTGVVERLGDPGAARRRARYLAEVRPGLHPVTRRTLDATFNVSPEEAS